MFSANHNHTRMRVKVLGKLMMRTTFGYPMVFRKLLDYIVQYLF